MLNLFSSDLRGGVKAQEPPVWNNVSRPLSVFEEDIVQKINSDGIAITHITNFGEEALSLFYETQRYALSEVGRQKNAIRWFQEELYKNEAKQSTAEEFMEPRTSFKRYIFDIKTASCGQKLISQETSFLDLMLCEPILNLIGHHFNNLPKLSFHFIGYTVPVPESYPQTLTQRWHRDPRPAPVVNFFIYLNDILSEENGPFTYMRNSHAKGKFYSLNPTVDKKLTYYPADGEVEKNIPDENKLVCLGTAGTIILADTSGFHRGGYSRRGFRLMATACIGECTINMLPWKGVKVETLHRLTVLGRLALGNYELA